MQALVFWLVYPLLWLISILPFRLFYLVSDFVFLLVYYVIRYRRKTVTENIQLVFPEKREAEVAVIRKKFYRHMCDMFLEMIKSLSISNEQLKKRFTFTNLEEVRRLEKLDKSLIVMCGHYASYEWMNSLQLYNIQFRAYGIYKRVANRYFDKLARDIRGKFDGELISTLEARKRIKANEEKGLKGIYAMIADQSPKKNRIKYWTDFLGVNVPVFMGSEKMAREHDMAVTYLHVEKVKRGYYRATFLNITDSPQKEPDYYITKHFIELLEEQIKQAPEYYLWTHKRWKHRNTPKPRNAVMLD